MLWLAANASAGSPKRAGALGIVSGTAPEPAATRAGPGRATVHIAPSCTTDMSAMLGSRDETAPGSREMSSASVEGAPSDEDLARFPAVRRVHRRVPLCDGAGGGLDRVCNRARRLRILAPPGAREGTEDTRSRVDRAVWRRRTGRTF